MGWGVATADLTSFIGLIRYACQLSSLKSIQIHSSDVGALHFLVFHFFYKHKTKDYQHHSLQLNQYNYRFWTKEKYNYPLFPCWGLPKSIFE